MGFHNYERIGILELLRWGGTSAGPSGSAMTAGAAGAGGRVAGDEPGGAVDGTGGGIRTARAFGGGGGCDSFNCGNYFN